MSLGVIAASYVESAGPGGGAVATLTVPSGKVSSTLTNFVTRVDLSDLPTDWWAATSSDLGNVRVKQSGSVIPFDIVAYDRAAETGEVFFKATLTTGDNVFTVECIDGATALAATDTNGRNAVWSDFDAVFMAAAGPTGGLVNRTGSGVDLSKAGADWSYVQIPASDVPLLTTAEARQGIMVDADDNVFIVTTNRIHKFNADMTSLLATQTDAAAAAGISTDHLGDGCVVGGELFLPAETYPSGTYSNQWITVWDISDLSFKRKYNISANTHEVSAIGFNSDDGYWYATEFPSSGSARVHKYDTSWNYVAAVAISPSVGSKQGMHYLGTNAFLVTASGGIYTVNTSTGATAQISDITTGSTNEGVTINSQGRLHILREASTPKVWLWDSTPATRRYGFGGRNYLQAVGLPKRTTWTMGVSSMWGSGRGSSNATMLSYSDNSGTNSNRGSLLTHTVYALWNSTNSFLNDPGAARTQDWATLRHHYTHEATTARTIWRNGALAATGGTAQRPASTGDTLFVGAEDTDLGEGWAGTLDRVYLRNGTLSADWLAAEYASWETPASFYPIT